MSFIRPPVANLRAMASRVNRNPWRADYGGNRSYSEIAMERRKSQAFAIPARWHWRAADYESEEFFGKLAGENRTRINRSSICDAPRPQSQPTLFLVTPAFRVRELVSRWCCRWQS